MVKMKQFFLPTLFILVLHVPGSQSLKCYSCGADGTECVNQVSTTCIQGVHDSCHKTIEYLFGKPKITAGCTTIFSCNVKERLCVEANQGSPAVFDCDIICCSGDHCNSGKIRPRQTPVTTSLTTTPDTKAIRSSQTPVATTPDTKAITCYDCSAGGTSCRTGMCSTPYQCVTLVTQTRDGKSYVVNTCLTKSSTSCSQNTRDNACAEIRRTNPAINSCNINCCSSNYCNVGQTDFNFNPKESSPTRPASLRCFECLDPTQGCRNNEVTCLPTEDQCGKAILSGENGRTVTAVSCTTSQRCSEGEQFCENLKTQDPNVKSCRIVCCSGNLCNVSPKIHQMYTAALVLGLVTALLYNF